MSDTEIPDFMPDDLDGPEPEPDDRFKMSDIIEMITGGSKMLTLEQVRMIGGDPITEEDVEGLEPEHRAAFLYTDKTLTQMTNAPVPHSPFLSSGGHDALHEGVKHHMEIVTRLVRIRMREEIKTLRGESDGRW